MVADVGVWGINRNVGMLIKLTFILANGNECVLYSSLSPDITFSLVSDQMEAKNAEDVAKAIRYASNREIWSEAEYRTRTIGNVPRSFSDQVAKELLKNPI